MNKALALILAPQTNEEEVGGRKERRKKLKNKGKDTQGPGFKTNQNTTAMSHDLESYSHSVFVTPFVAVTSLFWLAL